MNKILFALFITNIFTLSSCSYAESRNDPVADRTNNLNEMQNWCIGRYTFQLPKEASLIGGNDKYDSFMIKSQLNAKKSDFESEIQEIQKKYSTKEDFIKNQTPIEKQGRTLTKIIWGHSTFARGTLPVDVYAFVYDQSTQTFFKITGGYSKKYEEESIAAINHLVKNLVGRDNAEMPNQAGICIINGFIKDSGQPFRHSNQSIGFEFKSAPSLHVVMESESTKEVLENLVDRTTNNIKKTSFAASVFTGIQTIRKGQKNQDNDHSLSGYEWIISAHMKGRDGIDAKWEHTGTAANALDPLIQLELNSGFRNIETDSSSLSQKEAMSLYEKILHSIKRF
ncbi:T6SS immunity protein Tli4 family protein [Acinetobacter sp. MB5]|uniref:T6SS immunity protein Tli4 family protein n=1 Tax=Acinetobacter sp. MB5 TaxID=2069438 RepID=UPI000DD0A940|nr:T6SS immunity protein Tli4 family protein [Acinetobacter sp. MB5]